MPNWRDLIRERLTTLNLPPTREAEIAEELASHAADRYRELRADGFPDDEARRLALEEVTGDDLTSQLDANNDSDHEACLAAGLPAVNGNEFRLRRCIADHRDVQHHLQIVIGPVLR